MLFFVRQLGCVNRVTFTPKYTAGAVESSSWNCTANFQIALQALFSILVPKVEHAFTACGTKGAVDRVERDGISREKAFETSRSFGGACRWHLNEKFALKRDA